MVVWGLIAHLFISDITFLYVSFLLLAIRFHDKSVITKHYSQVHHECGPGLSVVLVQCWYGTGTLCSKVGGGPLVCGVAGTANTHQLYTT